jgi:hypothetical protein
VSHITPQTGIDEDTPLLEALGDRSARRRNRFVLATAPASSTAAAAATATKVAAEGIAPSMAARLGASKICVDQRFSPRSRLPVGGCERTLNARRARGTGGSAPEAPQRPGSGGDGRGCRRDGREHAVSDVQESCKEA